MIAALIIFMILCVWLLAQHIRSILQLRSICGQLEEMERGSHMELGVYSRRREVLKLCRTWKKQGQSFWEKPIWMNLPWAARRKPRHLELPEIHGI